MKKNQSVFNDGGKVTGTTTVGDPPAAPGVQKPTTAPPVEPQAVPKH